MRGSHSTRYRLLVAGHSTRAMNSMFARYKRKRVECPEQAIARRRVAAKLRMNSESDLSSLATLHPPSAVPGRAFVYILACKDDSLYIGSAYDVAKRLAEHGGHRGAKFTRDHPGARLVYTEGPLTHLAAVQRERQLKRWRRAKKLALIQNQIARLKELS